MTTDTHDVAPALERPGAGKHSNGRSTGHFYKIEFRGTDSTPQFLGDPNAPFPFVIDHYWRELHVTKGATPWGVNIPIKAWNGNAAEHGCLTYVAAEAHRWAFLAALEAGRLGGASGVETRLVEVKLHTTFSVDEVGVSPPQRFHWKGPETAPRALTSAERDT